MALGRANWLHVGGDGVMKAALVLLCDCASATQHRRILWSHLGNVFGHLAARPAAAEVSDLEPDTWGRADS